MTTIKIWQLFYVYFLFEECETRRVYTSRTFQTVSGGGSIQNRNPNLSTAMSNIGNVPLNNFFSNENGKLTIPKQILANLPPGASVSISTKINIGQPGRSVSTIQTRDPAGKTITRQNIQNVPNHTNFSNGRRWKTYRKTWSKSIPVSSIPKSNNRRSNLPNIWTSNLQNVSMSNIFTGIPNQTFIPKEWLANLPPGAHVKFSSSSSVIPQGAHVNFRQSSSVIPHGAHVNFRSSSRVIPHGAHVKFSSSSSVIPQGLSTVHSNQQGRVRKITRIISTYNDHQSVQDNQRRRNRHLPQPLPSLQPGVYCGDTLCEEEKFLMLEEHNRVRRSTNPQAADMKKIVSFHNTKLCLINRSFFVCLMVFNATFNNISVISWRSGLLVEETGGHGENNRPIESH